MAMMLDPRGNPNDILRSVSYFKEAFATRSGRTMHKALYVKGSAQWVNDDCFKFKLTQGQVTAPHYACRHKDWASACEACLPKPPPPNQLWLWAQCEREGCGWEDKALATELSALQARAEAHAPSTHTDPIKQRLEPKHKVRIGPLVRLGNV